MATQQNQSSPTGPSDGQFQEALNNFLDNLSDHERVLFKSFEMTKFRDSSHFLKDFEKLGSPTKDRKFGKIFRAVKIFSDHLNPYFSMLDLIAQSCPQWTAIAWGAFRVVLQLATNFSTFFDKLSELLAEVSAKLPAYIDVAQIDKSGTSDRLRLSIREFYVDLFDLFTAIVRVFTQKSGRLRKTPAVIGQLLWQPFDLRFGNFVSRLRFHKEIIDQEIRIAHWKQTRRMAEEQSEETQSQEHFRAEAKNYFDLQAAMRQEFSSMQKEALVDRIRQWLDPPCFAEPFERALKARQEGTSEWLFDREAFKTWIRESQAPGPSEPQEGCLWLQGNPGAGKTVLAASTVDYLESLTNEPKVFYFFFEQDATRMSFAADAYRSLLAQILQSRRDDPRIVDLFSFAMSGSRRGQSVATRMELVALLSAVLTQLKSSSIIIDAADECDEPDGLMLELFKIRPSANTKLLILSRPNVALLRRKMKSHQTVLMDRDCVRADLRLYFQQSLDDLQELGLMPEDIDNDELVEHLILGADGMFQWALVMMAYLKSRAMTPRGRVQIIKGLKTPERLDKMYFRTLELIAGHHFHGEQMLARRIFLWLVFQKRTLRAEELQDIATLSIQDDPDHDLSGTEQAGADGSGDFESTVILTCASLVERRHDGVNAIVYRFIHRSVFEFFVSNCEATEALCGSKPGSLVFFFPPTYEAETQLTIDSLSYLVRRIPKKPLSGNMFEPAVQHHIKSLPPFLGYASTNWPSHLTRTTQLSLASSKSQPGPILALLTRLLRALASFFDDRLVPMSWLEAIYTFAGGKSAVMAIYGKLDAWADSMAQLRKELIDEAVRDIPVAVSLFAADMTHLHDLWGDTLQKGPCQIWNDITAFTPSPFLIKTSAVTVRSMVADGIQHKGLGLQPLSRISRDAKDSDTFATLTIWPSRNFEARFKKNQVKDLCQLPAGLTSGWMLQYQLWDLEPEAPVVIEDHTCALEEAEVELQIRRFGRKASKLKLKRKTSKNELALHFPSSISDDLNTFTVLRTMFRKVPAPDHLAGIASATHSWTSTQIPVSHNVQSRRSQYDAAPGVSNSANGKPWIESHDIAALEFEKTLVYKIGIFDDYILYETFEGDGTSDLFSEGNEAATTIAVFQISGRREPIDVTLLGYIKGDKTQFSGYVSNCTFHPHLALIAFHVYVPCGQNKIILWFFAEGRLLEPPLPTFLTFYSVRKRPSCTSWNINDSRNLQSLRFSATGMELVYTLRTKSNPTVLSIEATSAYTMARSSATRAPQQASARQETALTTWNADRSLGPSLSLPRVLHQDDVVLHDGRGGALTRLHFDPHTDNRDIQLVQTGRGPGDEARQSILSLPKWADIEHVWVSARMPTETRRDKIRLILNKSTRTFYTYASSAEEAEPAVVDKDLRALAPTRKMLSSAGDAGPGAAGKIRGVDGVRDSFGVEIEEASGDQRPAKKPRTEDDWDSAGFAPANWSAFNDFQTDEFGIDFDALLESEGGFVME